MARYHGKVGYAETVEESPGVYVENITERSYFGEVIRNSRRLIAGDLVNPTVSFSNSISIVADAYLREQFSAIRYVEWMGILWSVVDVEVQSPRLILSIGEVYRGPTPGAPAAP
jgi:hypothetical protein